MTIKKLDHEWATSGDKTTPSDEKIQEGWVGGDRPTVEYFNYCDNRQDNKINKLIRERVDTFYTDAADPNKMITTGVWSEDWSAPVDSVNYINAGSAKQIVDVKCYFNSDNEPRLLLLDQANDKIEVWNPRTLAHIRTTDALSADMVGGDTYYVMSMCTDGTTVYVMYWNDTDSTCEVNAWTINESSSNWTCEWSAERTLDGSGTGAYTQRSGDLCIADDDHIACITAHNTISVASTTKVITVLNKSDGSINADGEGCGDAPAGVSAVANTNSSICSDGTNIYFTVVNGAGTNNYLCSATIADTTVGCGGAAWPQTYTGLVNTVVCSAGDRVITGAGKSSAWVATDIAITTSNAADANCDVILLGDNGAGTPVVNDEIYYHNPSCICFDGLHFWIINDHLASSAHTGLMLTRIDAGKFCYSTATNNREVGDLGPDTFLIASDKSLNANGYKFRRCVFDGRDIWVCPDAGLASQATSGRIYRLPLAALRS